VKIGIAAILGTLGGPRTYARSLVEALGRVDDRNEYWVFTDQPDAVPQQEGVHPVHVPLGNRYAQPLWDHVRLPQALARFDLDLLHHTKAALPLGLRVPSVVAVYDAAPFLHARSFTRVQGIHHRGHIRDAARRATRLVTISEEARGDLARALPLDRQRITVVPPGSAGVPLGSAAARGSRASTELLARHGITGPFVLALGTVQPRKDLGTVVRAFLRMRERSGLAHQLVVAGRAGWGDGTLERLCASADDRSAIVSTGALADGEVAALFGSASVAVNASLYEGFGLAVLEALAHGVPLVSTDVPALSGAPDDAFLRVTPGDVGGLSCAIERLLGDPSLGARLVASGRRHAARFSWDDTARATLAVYREALEERRRF